MCLHLSEELSDFDYRKEQELKRVFIEYAESRFDVFEKVRSKTGFLFILMPLFCLVMLWLFPIPIKPHNCNPKFEHLHLGGCLN